MRRSLPDEIVSLRLRVAALRAAHKNAQALEARLVMLVARQIRREVRLERNAKPC